MALDPDLLRDAEAARERLADAQRAAGRARADYHDAVRRLQAAGGSLREIAEALGRATSGSTRSSAGATRSRPGRARSAAARARSARS